MAAVSTLGKPAISMEHADKESEHKDSTSPLRSCSLQNFANDKTFPVYNTKKAVNKAFSILTATKNDLDLQDDYVDLNKNLCENKTNGFENSIVYNKNESKFEETFNRQTIIGSTCSITSVDRNEEYNSAIVNSLAESEIEENETNETSDESRHEGKCSVKGAKKRLRTQFKTHQLAALENAFLRNHNPDRNEREVLSSNLKLCERTIRYWFQNRRQRFREKRDQEQHTSYLIPKFGPLEDAEEIGKQNNGRLNFYFRSKSQIKKREHVTSKKEKTQAAKFKLKDPHEQLLEGITISPYQPNKRTATPTRLVTQTPLTQQTSLQRPASFNGVADAFSAEGKEAPLTVTRESCSMNGRPVNVCGSQQSQHQHYKEVGVPVNGSRPVEIVWSPERWPPTVKTQYSGSTQVALKKEEKCGICPLHKNMRHLFAALAEVLPSIPGRELSGAELLDAAINIISSVNNIVNSGCVL